MNKWGKKKRLLVLRIFFVACVHTLDLIKCLDPRRWNSDFSGTIVLSSYFNRAVKVQHVVVGGLGMMFDGRLAVPSGPRLCLPTTTLYNCIKRQFITPSFEQASTSANHMLKLKKVGSVSIDKQNCNISPRGHTHKF